MTSLTKYDAACRALAECRTVDEVLEVRDHAERIRLYARQAKDRQLLADASDIHLRAERQLGVMLKAAKELGQISRGQPAKRKAEKNCAEPEQFSRITLEEAGIDRKLSARSQKVASISERAFEEMVARTRARIAAGGALTIDREISASEKKERRATHEQVLGAMQVSLPSQKFGVILADPEWRFEPWSRETGMDRAAENHYPTSCTEVIASRDVPSIAARDCVLFLWATQPMLPQALLVMAAWGFDYKTHLIWKKPHPITGYWFRSVHELLLVGTRGAPPAPAMGTQPVSVIEAKAENQKHSKKPDLFLEMIEGYFPTMPKIELNRRGPPRPGWSAWGNEAEPIVPHDPETGEIAETDAMPAATAVTAPIQTGAL